MKVLYISDEDQLYGAPKSLVNLIDSIDRNTNIEVCVLTPEKGPLNKELDSMKIENYSVGSTKFYYYLGDKVLSRIMRIFLYPIVRFIAFIKMMVVVHHIKKVVDLKKIDIIHSNVSVNKLGVVLSKKYKIPLIWHLREVPDILNKNVTFFPKNRIDYMNRCTDRFIAISYFIKRKWVEAGIDQKKVTVIYDSINFIDEANKKRNNFSKNGTIDFVSIGKANPQKNQLEFLKAIALLPDEQKDRVSFTIYGGADRAYLTSLNNFAQKNDLMSVFSVVDYKKNIFRSLDKFNVGVTVSVNEGLGRPTIEYMLAKLPVIVSESGANNELVSSNNGFLYKLHDYKSLSKIINNILNNHFDLLRMGQYGRRQVKEQFSYGNTTDKVVETYFLILKGG